MKQLNEFEIDPVTGKYVDQEDYERAMAHMAADNLPTEPEIEVDQEVDQVGTEPAIDAVTAENLPIVYVRMRDMVTASDDEYEIVFDVSLAVEVRDPACAALVDAGIVTKRMRISKAGLAQELTNRSAATPVTESLLETVLDPRQQQLLEAEKKERTQATMKRMRELAGIPGKGNWV